MIKSKVSATAFYYLKKIQIILYIKIAAISAKPVEAIREILLLGQNLPYYA
jgi:hypothetical protein